MNRQNGNCWIYNERRYIFIMGSIAVRDTSDTLKIKPDSAACKPLFYILTVNISILVFCLSVVSVRDSEAEADTFSAVIEPLWSSAIA